MKYYGVPKYKEIEKWLEVAEGFELQDFFLPDLLDDPAGLEERVEAYLALPGRDRAVIHGPFLDIAVHSSDSLIRKAGDLRIRQVCDIAVRLGVSRVVLHTNLIANFYEPTYRKNWVRRNEEYLRTLLQDYPSITICMENMFDEEPDCLVELAQAMEGQRFAICLDIAHAFLSKTPVAKWLRVCNPYVSHYHINDNHKIVDEHLAVGEGNIPWRDILPLLKPNASVLIEVDSMEKFQKSLSYLSCLY